MTDILPANVTFGSARAIQGSCSEASGTVTCNLGTIDTGASATATITVTPVASAVVAPGGNSTGDLTNTVSVTSEVGDPNTGNNSGSQSTVVFPLADLSVTGDGSPDPAPAGGLLTYNLVVTNNGPSRATDVVLTGTLPSNVIYGLAVSNRGSCSEESRIVTCDIGHINSGDTVAVTITVTPTGVAGDTTITSTADVKSPVTDPNTGDNTASQATDIILSSDLSVTVDDPPNGAIEGEELTYTVTVTNSGPSVATGVTLTDVLPESGDLVSSTPSQGNCSGQSTVTCSLGGLASGDSAIVTLVVTVTVDVNTGETKTITNSAAVTGDEFDPDATNNEAEVITTVYVDEDGDGIGSQVEAGAPNNGDGNNDGTGDSDQDNVVSLHNAVDAQYATIASAGDTRLKDVEAIENPSTGALPRGEVFPAGFFGFEVENLQSGGSTTVELLFPEGTIIPSYWKYGPTSGDATPHWYEFMKTTGGTTGAFINGNKVTLYFVDGQRGDDDLTANGNIVDAGGPVFAPADLSLIHTDDPDPVPVGETLTYTLVVTNNGPSRATSVVLTDTLPANVAFGSATSSQGEACSQESGTVTCSLGTIDTGASATTTITVTPEEAKGGATGGTKIFNTADAVATEADSDDTNNIAIWQDTAVKRQADTSVTGDGSTGSVLVGRPLTYTLIVTNHGPSQATKVVMVDTLPDNVIFESVVTSLGSCVHADETATTGATVTCSLGKLDADATATISIVVTPTVEAGGNTITNIADVTSDVDDSLLENNNVEEKTVVIRNVDLSVTKSDTPDPVPAEDTLTYFVTVTNGGPSLATAVVLTDTMPASAKFESATPSQGQCAETSGTVTCTLGAIVKDASATVTITATPTQGNTTITNTADVKAAEIDPESGNDVAVQSTTVGPSLAGPQPFFRPQSDFSVTMADSPDPVLAGEEITYTLTVTNNGPRDDTAVILTDVLPVGSTLVSASTSQRTCDGTSTVTCVIGTLHTGESATVTIIITAMAAGTITNTASVSGNNEDRNTGDNTATESTTVNPAADLSLTKVNAPDPVPLGNNLTYTLTVNNKGPSITTDVTLIDTLPETVTLLSSSASQGTCSGISTIICTLGTLASGDNATVTIVVTPTSTGDLANTASVASSVTDPNSGDNTATETTEVNSAADLSVSKAASPDPVLLEEELTYSLTVTNNGPSDATDATLTDTLPEGVSFVAASGDCAEVGGTVTCNLSTLARGDNVTVTIVVTATAAGTITNTASVTSSVTDPSTGDNTVVESTTVSAVADLSLTKSESSDPVPLGNNLTYTLTVSNSGPSSATGVTLRDVLPEGVTFVSASAGCAEADGTVTCNLGALASSINATVTIEVTVETTPTGTLRNTASVTGNEVDPNSSNNTAIEVTKVQVGELKYAVTIATGDVDIVGINLTDSPDPVFVGNSLIYDLTISNSGSPEVEGVVLTVVLPSSVTFVSVAVTRPLAQSPPPASVARQGTVASSRVGNSVTASASRWAVLALPVNVSFASLLSATDGSCTGERTIICDLGNLSSNESVTVTIEVTPTVPGILNNQAEVLVRTLGQTPVRVALRPPNPPQSSFRRRPTWC